jgi:hypothetical protein
MEGQLDSRWPIIANLEMLTLDHSPAEGGCWG